jgi:flagellar biosynthesis/type III secretory pathway chaperone
MKSAASAIVVSLTALRGTLEAERAALIANDADALLRLSDLKLCNLRDVQATACGDDISEIGEELRALAQLNIANGALIARRRQETVWTLRHLGLYERDSAYDGRGACGNAIKSRHRISA